ncbi:hypothetical protein DPMN_150846 [Dreissena polymorpha]|uniref:Uncharacterized protein n=1 Tax=Dreissena polymorpha TaxID=45954 RepID=A0A9D4J5Y9_DREPO|nr:hypothetical protein DPMN_150846 [Dreissena polymorpha]
MDSAVCSSLPHLVIPTMDGEGRTDGVSLPCDLDDLTFRWVERHQPVPFPFLQPVQVLLQGLCVLCAADLPVQEAIVCEEASW